VVTYAAPSSTPLPFVVPASVSSGLSNATDEITQIFLNQFATIWGYFYPPQILSVENITALQNSGLPTSQLPQALSDPVSYADLRNQRTTGDRLNPATADNPWGPSAQAPSGVHDVFLENYNPARMVDFLWHNYQPQLQSMGYTNDNAGYAKLTNDILSSTAYASELADQFHYGPVETCGQLGCTGGDTWGISASNFWTASYLSMELNDGLPSSQYQTLVNIGIDSATSLQAVEAHWGAGGTGGSYQPNEQLYGADATTLKISVPNYMFMSDGSIVIGGQAQLDTRGCGHNCLMGGGTSSIVVPSEVATQLGSDKLRILSQGLTAVEMGLPIVSDATASEPLVEGSPCSQGCETLSQYKQFVDVWNEFAGLMQTYNKNAGNPAAYWGQGIMDPALGATAPLIANAVFLDPISGALNDLTFGGSAWPDITDATVSAAGGKTSAGLTIGTPSYANALYQEVQNYGWVALVEYGGLTQESGGKAIGLGAVIAYLNSMIGKTGVTYSSADLQAAVKTAIDDYNRASTSQLGDYKGMVTGLKAIIAVQNYCGATCNPSKPGYAAPYSQDYVDKQMAQLKDFAAMTPDQFADYANKARQGQPGYSSVAVRLATGMGLTFGTITQNVGPGSALFAPTITTSYQQAFGVFQQTVTLCGGAGCNISPPDANGGITISPTGSTQPQGPSTNYKIDASKPGAGATIKTIDPTNPKAYTSPYACLALAKPCLSLIPIDPTTIPEIQTLNAHARAQGLQPISFLSPLQGSTISIGSETIATSTVFWTIILIAGLVMLL
jgi:hypothetical protein